MGKSVSAAEAKAHFAQYLRQAEEGEAIIITRHGKAVAALLKAESARQIERLCAAGPEAGLLSVAGGWKGSEHLARTLTRTRRAGSRRAPNLDR
jgi:prevent-host-death family protein